MLTRILALSAILLGLMTAPGAYAQDPEGNGVIWETRMKVGQQGDLTGFRTGPDPIGTMDETAFEWQGTDLEVRTLTFDQTEAGRNHIVLEISGSLAESHALSLRVNLQFLRLDQAATSGDNRRFSWSNPEEHPGWIPGETLGIALLDLRVEPEPDIPQAGESTREPTAGTDRQTNVHQESGNLESSEPGHQETQEPKDLESGNQEIPGPLAAGPALATASTTASTTGPKAEDPDLRAVPTWTYQALPTLETNRTGMTAQERAQLERAWLKREPTRTPTPPPAAPTGEDMENRPSYIFSVLLGIALALTTVILLKIKRWRQSDKRPRR